MNDSFRTDVFVRFDPETIACACIYLAARQLQICLPNNPAWFLVFNVDEDDLKDISLCILRLYSRAKPNVEKLEEIVNEVKKRHVEAKMRARGVPASASGTPSQMTSLPGSPLAKVVSSPSANLLPAALKKIRSEDERSDNSLGARKRKLSPDRGHGPRQHRSHSRSMSRSPVRNNHRPRAYRSPSSGSDRSRPNSPSDGRRPHKNSAEPHKTNNSNKRHRERSRSKKHHRRSPDVIAEIRVRDKLDSKDTGLRHLTASRSHRRDLLPQRSSSSASLTTAPRIRDRSRSAERLKRRNGHHDRDGYRR